MPTRKTAARKRRAPAKRPSSAKTRSGNKRPAAKRAVAKKAGRRAGKKWSARVMRTSDAMDLESGVFKKRSARQVALSLKKSAESSHRRKSTPFRSAMSMLNFEINRAGRGLSAERRRVLNQAKVALRKAFHRPQG
jgi:hypothetical protein